MKRWIAMLLAMLMLVPAACAEGRYEGEGFDSAEAAVQAYVEAFNAGDVQAMLSTFAIETYVERTDRLASIGRMTIFSTNNYDTYPMPNDYMRQLLIVDRVGGLARYMTGQYMMYIWPEEGYGRYDDGAPLPLRGDEEASAFLSAFDDAAASDWTGKIAFNGFASLEDLDSGLKEIMTRESTLKNISLLVAGRGCDEMANLIASLTVDGKDGFLFMECSRYGDRWYNTSLGGILATVVGMNPSYAGLGIAGGMD